MEVSAKAQVMVLGCYHMANPGLDLVKSDIRDTLSPERQTEIELLIGRLSRFAPTKIAVEALAQGRVGERYQSLLNNAALSSRSFLDSSLSYECGQAKSPAALGSLG